MTTTSELRLSAALLAVMAALTLALAGLVTGATWWLELLLVSVVVLGVAAGCRAIPSGRHPGLPHALAPVAAFVALVMVVTALFAPQTALFGVIPTPSTIAQFCELVVRSRASLYTQGVPADPVPEFLFLLVGVGGLIAFVCDLLALVVRIPSAVGLLMAGALIAPAALLNSGISPVALAACLVAYLLLLRADMRVKRGTVPEIASSFTIAAGAIVVALVIGTTAPGFQQVGRQSIPAAGVMFGEGGAPLVDLGADLRRPAAVPVMDYTTTAAAPGYLQMTTLDVFSGTVWRHTRTASDFFTSETTVTRVPGLKPGVKTGTAVTKIQVHDLTSQWLPAPYPVSRLSGLNGSWGVERDDLTIAGYTASTADQSYRVVTRTVEPTAARMRESGDDYPRSVQRDLTLPPDMPSIIRTTAEQVTAGATTAYDKAIALQTYFHDGDFRYSLDAPRSGGYDDDTPGTIAKFLVKKAGYCVHFAAAMTLMARELGIPARIGVGYLPGDVTGSSGHSTSYQVSSDDLHAWPELYFPGVGWVQFEPTVGRGTVPNYEPAKSTAVSPTDEPSASATADPRRLVPTDAPIAGGGTSSPDSVAAISSSGTVAAVVLLLIALMLTPAIVRRRLRARRVGAVRGGGGTATTAWSEVRATALDLGLAAPMTETPRAFADRLSRTWNEAPGSRPDAVTREAASLAIRRLQDALEHERFGPPDRSVADPALADDLIAVVGTLGSTAGLARRTRAALMPVSLFEGRTATATSAGPVA